MKQNLTQYGDGELSLLFLNDQGLYNVFMSAVRRKDFGIVKDLADEMYIYTPEQIDELEIDFNNEVEDYNKE